MRPMKVFLLVLFLWVFPLSSFGNDTDIYAARGQGVEPNILIIFDNSQSMSETVPCQANPTSVYSKTTYYGGYYWSEYALSVSAAITKLGSKVCSGIDSTLNSTGDYNGYTTKDKHGNCNSNKMELATGAWILANDAAHAGDADQCAKIDVAKKVITDFVTNINNVRVGLMIFNSAGCEKYADGRPKCRTTTTHPSSTHTTEVRDVHGNCTYGCLDSLSYNDIYEGGHIQSIVDSVSNNRTTLISQVNGLTASTYTPLAETLFEAGLYFKGANTIFNMDTGGTYPNNFPKYVSPIQYSCQKNYIIIITDGKSTMDHNAALNTLANNGDYDNKGEDPYGPSPCNSSNSCYDSGGTDYLNDVAKYLYDSQGISVFTIGLGVDYDLLQRAAEEANGHYYTTSDANGLQDAFVNVIDEILDKSTSFVAPIVPVSRLEKTTAGDKIYLALFKPKNSKEWSGNIKKYGVAQSDGSGYKKGDLLDSHNLKATDDSTGQFLSGAISFWNTDQDGDDVEKGGAGEVLLNQDIDNRNIYTFFPSSGTVQLYGNNNNAFTTTNPLITTSVLNLASGSTDDLINFVYGHNAYQDDVCPNKDITDAGRTRCWILGSCLHSRPFFVSYKNQNVIFVGSNDGMLHAFNDADGTELWAFIPPDLLPNLQYLHSDMNLAYVDGSPKGYVAYDSSNNVTQAILIFGERRGGNRYYALDVTNPSRPLFLWYISPAQRVYNLTTYTTSDYAELGQSWSAPNIGKIACTGGSHCTNGERWVAFIGGGYDDTNEDKQNPYTTVPDSKGRAIYVVDIFDGSLIKRFSNLENASMTYSIPSDISKVDLDGDGRVDRLYVGDMAGRMWRFDVKDTNPSNWTSRIIFNSPAGATAKLKIFYPPDVTLDLGYEMLFFGTGDREHPNDKTNVNRLYGVKDRGLSTPYGEANLVDVTADLLQTGTSTQIQDTVVQLNSNTNGGWFIQLSTNLGEKCLAPATVFYGVAYFTTFGPAADAPPPGSDPCYVGEGTAWLYELGYKTGAAAFNLDLSNDTGSGNNKVPAYGASDRSQWIGTAIPSGVIITVIQDTAAAYAGMGGGVIGSQEYGSGNNNNNNCPNGNCPKIYFKNGKPLVPVNWRISF